jgi:hypothetical protein
MGMEALKSLRRADLLEIARLAGVPQASRKSKQQLVESIATLNLADLPRNALLCLARHLGLKNPQRVSKAALARRLANHIQAAVVERPQEQESEAAAASWEIDHAIRTQLLSSSKISSELSSPPVPDVPEELGLEQLRVTQAKFSPGIRHHLLIDQEARLPDEYGVNRAVLLVRDPFWLFLYWEMTPEALAVAARQDFQDSVIRVHDVTGLDPFENTSRSHFDVLCGSARSWYISVPGDDRDYRAEIGSLTKRGEFLSILRSNTVSMPPARMSSRVEDRFMTVPFDQSLRPEGQRVEPALRSSAWFSRYAPLHLRMARLSVPGAPERSPDELFAAVDTVSGRAHLSGRGVAEFEVSRPGGGPALFSKADGSLSFQIGPDHDLIGRTDPDATVRVNGNPVPLDSLGRFHVHFNVPTGGNLRPVLAHSSSPGKKHEIVIQWTRA